MRSFFLIATLCAVTACWPAGKRPVAQAQFCITPEHGPLELVDTFRAIAKDEGMDLLSRGAPEDALKASRATYKGAPLPQGLEVAVSSSDDQDGFSAAVSGPPANEVMMGFSEGHDRRLSSAFAGRVIARLRQKWDVHVVSGEVGMFPLKTCSPNKA